MITIDLFWVIVYFIVVLIIGILSAKQESKESFLIAERKLGALSSSTSIAAGFMGGGMLLAYVAYVYQFGMAALWIFIGIIIGLFLLLFYHKKIKQLADKEKFYTISDYFKHKYGKSVGIISAIAVLIVFFFFLLIEFIGGGKILSGLINIPYEYSIIIMAVVVLIYLGLGGFTSVVKTDMFQYLIILLFTIIIGGVLISNTNLPTKEFSLAGAGLGNSVAFVILGAFATFMAPDLWQRIYAAKSTKVAKQSLYLCSALIFIFGFIITLIGIVAKVNFPDISPDIALVYGLSNLLPHGILGLGLVMLFAAIMSSVDTSLFVLGMNISQDITSSHIKITKKQLICITRWAIIGIALISVLIAIFIENIITVALAFGSTCLVLVPALIGSFHFKLNEKAVFHSILIGIVAVFVILLSGYITPESSLISLPVSLIVLIIGQIISRYR